MTFSFNGMRVGAFEGDTVAGALVRAGVHTFSRSMKFHRPRGLYCGAGRCISCAMRVNGIPWVRTCTLPVAEGMVVESQGGVPGTGFDVLSFFDLIFRKEFDYHSRFIRPRFLTPVYQGLVRRLASPASLPGCSSISTGVTVRDCNVLVIGQGVSGSVAAARLKGADVSGVVTIDRMQGSEERVPSVAFGIYEGGEVGVQVGEAVHLIRPRFTLLATGCLETGLPLVNGELPGVMLPGALSMLVSRGILPGQRAVVVGSNELRPTVLRDLGALGVKIVGEIEDPTRVHRIVGRNRVRAADVRENGHVRRIACDTVVVLGPVVPAIGLASQAGCHLESRDGSLAVSTDPSGRTSVRSVFACGGVAGIREQAERIASAERAADSIVSDLEAG